MIPLQMFPELDKVAGCNMCGKCCEVINLPVSHEEFKVGFYRDGEFILKYWKPISEEEALRINQHIRHGVDGTPSFYYTCDKYDVSTKLCTAHTERPSVCSQFPWYGKPINNQALSMHLNCSYWLDVPVEAWPNGVEI